MRSVLASNVCRSCTIKNTFPNVFGVRQNNLLPRNLSTTHVNNCSTSIEEPRTYELGNFSDDLKPYLSFTKRRKEYDHFASDHLKDQPPIIKCKNPRLNHYPRQTYDKYKAIPLASQNWRGHKSIGDYFTIHIHNTKKVSNDESLGKNFEDSELSAELIDILKQHNIEQMSEIQEKSINPILSRKNTLIAAETGCGKTLAYLLPIFEQILNWKKDKKEEYNAPFVVIVTPSRELTEQIHEVIKWFKPLNITSHKLLGGFVSTKIMNPVVGTVDILVTTLGIVSRFVFAGVYSLKNVRHIVLDEADALLDDSFNEKTVDFLRKFKYSTKDDSILQLTLVSATMPTSLQDILGEIVEVDFVEKVVTDNVHKAMPHVIQKFLRINRSTKPAYLLEIAKKEYAKKSPLLIFCNNYETSDWVSVFLNENNVNNLNLNKEMGLRLRKDRFKKFQDGEVNILVTTSIASRGLDTVRVRHVLNYDFPLFISDYIHRCGRTGRLGSKYIGKVTNFIAGKNEIELVQKIEQAVRTMTEFENVNPNIKRILTFRNASGFEKRIGEVFTDDEDETPNSSNNEIKLQPT